MKDIDFDELDRAVNSLISPSGAPQSASSSPAAPVVATPPQPVVSAPTLTPTTPPLAERRSSGRFMDVVHPSSDMRPVAVPARPVAAAPAMVTPPASEPLAPAAAWPDPIDMHEAANNEVAAAPIVSSPTEPSADMTAPLESPFLSDAKVEKRPLGAFSNEVHASGPSEPAVVPKPVDEPEAVTSTPDTAEGVPKAPDHQIQNDTPLPAELQPGLLSIEANEDPSKVTLSTAIPTATESTGPTSITQQYTEQPSTGDKPTGSVFDTEAYKKPQPSKKKKSGWLIVLWIFLLLVVGAGIGAAVYFFVLPRL